MTYFNSNESSDFFQSAVSVSRVAKVTTGGRRFRFSALMVVGDRRGRVGIGFAKAGEAPDAMRKGTERAKKNMHTVSVKGTTIPHQVIGVFGSGKVLLRPASEGTGVIAGSAVRAVLEAVGIHDVLTKSIGSQNPHNVVKATLQGLLALRTQQEINIRRGII